MFYLNFRAYLNFQRAADLNHKKAKEMVAFGHLFGDYLPQNITRAQELFVERAGQGSPTAQMVCTSQTGFFVTIYVQNF